MKTFYTSLLLFSLIITPVFSQTDTLSKLDTVKYWKKGGFAVLTFNQVNLDNWAAGGENALSATGILNLFANYKKGNVIWDNSLDLGYGLMRSDKQVRKNEDKIELSSKFGYKATGNFYYSFLFNYRTQFAAGYNYPNDSMVISKFNAPGYLSFSLGIDYKPVDYFSLFLSPATGKFTIVADKTLSDLGAYGVEPGKKIRPEFGANLTMKFQKDLIKNVNLVSKLILFNSYTDKVKENRKNIDVNWETMLNIKAGKFLTTSIMANLIYDQDVLAKTQFKEVLGVGLSYKF